MNYEQIKNFLIFPELPDIISYLLYAITIISIVFVKAYVKRDNSNTIFKINEKTTELDRIKSEYEKEKKELEVERKQMAKELKTIKNAIKQSSNNSHELVSNGTANEISKMLDNEMQDLEEENKDEIP